MARRHATFIKMAKAAAVLSVEMAKEAERDRLVQTSEHEIQKKYTSTGRFSGYYVDLYCDELDERKVLQATDYDLLLLKIDEQIKKWQSKYNKQLEKEEKQRAKETKQKSIADCEQKAIDHTQKAQKEIEHAQSILAHTLDIDDAIDWNSLKYNDTFQCPAEANHLHIIFNSKDGYPKEVRKKSSVQLPTKNKFLQPIGFWSRLFGQSEKIKNRQMADFEQALAEAKKVQAEVDQENHKREDTLKTKQTEWQNKKDAFDKKQNDHNAQIDALQQKYQQKDCIAVTEYCEMVLNNSIYPDNFPKEFLLQYNPNNHMLLVDYHLPTPNVMPSVKSVSYVKSKDEFQPKILSQKEQNALYNKVVYQIALRTVHELFEADIIDAVQTVNFNGLVTTTNRAKGVEETKCILSLQTDKQTFEAINLAGITTEQSFKECFKLLKGVDSTDLAQTTPIKPLLQLETTDKRFVAHYNVADNLDTATNLAAMDWQDFEHLVREVFAKEFSESGGEVNVTQSSKDGGVDAVAFDRDPIRGGKIVIQAKRYTNTVGVSAVRDLYGTVLNEGAIKGILITTSDYGADSYEFAKDKPLTLLNGGNLLHLLEKHGHKAKINIQEAKTQQI